MKKIFSLAVLFLLYAHHVSAANDAAQPLPAVKKMPPATSFTTNEVFDFFFEVFVPCANNGEGEWVVLEGRLHAVFHVTINNNMVQIKSHFQPQGISGVGLTSGLKYQATGVTQERVKTSLQSAQNFTYVNNFRIIGQGPGNNFLVHENVHLTINANGTLTASVDNFSVECK